MSRFSINKTPKDVQSELVDKIKSIRKTHGLSQEKLALRSGVSLGSVKRFETTGQISLYSLLKITHVLGRLSDFDLILNEELNKDINQLFSI